MKKKKNNLRKENIILDLIDEELDNPNSTLIEKTFSSSMLYFDSLDSLTFTNKIFQSKNKPYPVQFFEKFLLNRQISLFLFVNCFNSIKEKINHNDKLKEDVLKEFPSIFNNDYLSISSHFETVKLKKTTEDFYSLSILPSKKPCFEIPSDSIKLLASSGMYYRSQTIVNLNSEYYYFQTKSEAKTLISNESGLAFSNPDIFNCLKKGISLSDTNKKILTLDFFVEKLFPENSEEAKKLMNLITISMHIKSKTGYRLGFIYDPLFDNEDSLEKFYNNINNFKIKKSKNFLDNFCVFIKSSTSIISHQNSNINQHLDLIKVYYFKIADQLLENNLDNKNYIIDFFNHLSSIKTNYGELSFLTERNLPIMKDIKILFDKYSNLLDEDKHLWNFNKTLENFKDLQLIKRDLTNTHEYLYSLNLKDFSHYMTRPILSKEKTYSLIVKNIFEYFKSQKKITYLSMKKGDTIYGKKYLIKFSNKELSLNNDDTVLDDVNLIFKQILDNEQIYSIDPIQDKNFLKSEVFKICREFFLYKKFSDKQEHIKLKI